jgi:pre-mRNA-splicing factor ATP-dependent RNA helicase DHX38/PRP16
MTRDDNADIDAARDVGERLDGYHETRGGIERRAPPVNASNPAPTTTNAAGSSVLGLQALAAAKRAEKRAREGDDDGSFAKPRDRGAGFRDRWRDGDAKTTTTTTFRSRRDETPSHPGGVNARAKEAIDKRRKDARFGRGLRGDDDFDRYRERDDDGGRDRGRGRWRSEGGDGEWEETPRRDRDGRMMTPRFGKRGDWEDDGVRASRPSTDRSRGGYGSSSRRSNSSRFDFDGDSGGDAVVEVKRMGERCDGEREQVCHRGHGSCRRG